MNEKDLKVLEQYNIQADKIYRGRGSYLCESKGKIYILKEYHVSEEKASAVAGIEEYIKQDSKLLVDCFVKNREEKYISRDRENVGFVLKEWFNGKECDIKNVSDIKLIIKQLALVHKRLESIDDVQLKQEGTGCYKEFEKRIKEMKKIRNYVSGKKGKTEFELLYIKVFGQYIDMAQKALEGAGALKDDKMHICHGDFNHHNVLIGEKGVCIVNFDKCHYGSQMEDLYLFMRKILEKNQWDEKLGKQMLLAYSEEKKLSENNVKELYLRFLFPEKFWKLSNHYYNARKVWGIERNLQKLEKLRQQTEIKQAFTEMMKQFLVS